MAIKTKLEDMQIGDKIVVNYAGEVYNKPFHFYILGSIHPTYPTIVPPAGLAYGSGRGYFHFIFVGKDFKGRMILVADRNVSHSISWDVLNTSGAATKDGVRISESDLGLDPTLWKTHIRLLTGGTSDATKANSEWDKYIVNGTGNGQYPAGDNATWNWNGLYSWNSSVSTTGSSHRVSRGNSTKDFFNYYTSTTALAYNGFRPVLVAESLKAPITNKYLIQDGQEIKKYVKGSDGVDLVPPMTAATVEGVTITESSVMSGYPGWFAFNDNDTGSSYGWNSNTLSNEWLKIQFPSPVVVNKYWLSSFGSGTPKDWRVEGSDTGVFAGEQITLHNVSGEGTISGDWRKVFSFNNTTAYNFYRIVISVINGGSKVLIKEMALYNSIVDHWEPVGIAPATKTMFDTHGMTDLSIVNDAAIQSLTSATPELLCWTDEVATPGVYSSDIVPQMTSQNDATGFSVTHSSVNGNDISAHGWKAFNNSASDYWYSQGGENQWLKITLPTPRIIQKFTIQSVPSGGDQVYSPMTFRLEGSETGSFTGEQVVLHQPPNQTAWTASQKREFIFTNTTAYKHYRLFVVTNNSTGSWAVLISEMELCEKGSDLNPSRTVTTTAIPKPTLLLPVGDIEIGEVESVNLETNITALFTDNIITTMTSDTAPSGVASSSGALNSTYDAWKAFNKTTTNNLDAWVTNSVQTGWLAYEFTSTKMIKKYAVTSRRDVNRGDIKSWTFEGFNESSGAWEILDSKVNEPAWASAERREYIISNTKSYKKYRINVTSVTLVGASYYLSIGELEMMEALGGNNDIKILVSGDSGVTWKGHSPATNAVPVMTSNTSPSGMASASSEFAGNRYAYFAFNGLSTGLPWVSNSGTNEWLQYEFDTPKTIEKYAIVGAEYSPSSSPKDFRFEGWSGSSWETLDTQAGITWTAGEKKSFTIALPKSYTKYRLFVLSDNGAGNVEIAEMQLMESPKSETVNISDLSQVKTKGLTPLQFNSLNKEELKTLFPNGKARFAFYLEQEKSTDIVEVQSVKINEKQFTLTPEITSLSVLYDVLKSERPKYYVSRNDGVDWKEIEPDQLTKLDDLPSGKKLRVKALLTNGQELHGLSYSWI